MESNNASSEYKAKVTRLLKQKIEAKPGRRYTLVEDYQNNGLFFDLAELNKSGNPLRV